MRINYSFVFWLLAVLTCLTTNTVAVRAQQSEKSAGQNKLVYADFQNLVEGRPVSARGGSARLFVYAQNMASPPKFRGFEGAGPPTPAAARVSDQDNAAAFEYELRMPNEWAGVNLEIFGQPEKDGKLVADDVSGYKFITLRLFAKGPKQIRVELISRGHGFDIESGYPSTNFRIQEGFNTYRLKLDTFVQPQWATQLDYKGLLRNLTSVSIGVFCNQCRPESGMVVVDNIAFEK